MISVNSPDEQKIWSRLELVEDPEIPVISIIDLGIIRGVKVERERVTVVITPTYSGCPALEAISQAIRSAVLELGFSEVSIEKVYSPPWSTDWISEEGRRKLEEYGIAPPGPASAQALVEIGKSPSPVPCPLCKSSNTELRSEFGSTACKAFHFCCECQQPFEAFKAI